MGIIASYQDLCREIDILEVRINNLEQEHKFLYKACFNGDRKPLMPLDMIMKRMNEICDTVEAYSTLLGEKERAKREIERHMSEFEGLEYKVGIMRDVKGMSLVEIALDLGYSYDWIRKISCRTKKRAAL